MRLPKVQTLFKTALGVTVAGVGSVIYMQLKRLEEISESEFFKETFKILRAHKGGQLLASMATCLDHEQTRLVRIIGAVQLMGEPIKQLGFRVDDPENYMTTDDAQFYVNVKGPNDKGVCISTKLVYVCLDWWSFSFTLIFPIGRVFLWAKAINDTWKVTRIELELNKHPGKRLLIKDGPTNNDEATYFISSKFV